MKLAIADPPYPAFIGAGGRKPRADRYYGTGQRSKTDAPADLHPDAKRWDDPAAHVELLAKLQATYDGWAIATTPDGVAAYGPLPSAARLMAWVRPNASPGAHRIVSSWEAVIVYPPAGRRSARADGVLVMRDYLVAPVERSGFTGMKPGAWTRWVLDAMGYVAELDTVDDLFPGSGAVQAELDQGVMF